VTESSLAPSTSGASSQPTYYLCMRPRPSPDFYNPASYSVSTEPTTYRETYFYLTGNTSIRFWSSYKLNPCLDIVYIRRFSILPEFIHRIEFF
jgi:hypothetical protein